RSCVRGARVSQFDRNHTFQRLRKAHVMTWNNQKRASGVCNYLIRRTNAKPLRGLRQVHAERTARAASRYIRVNCVAVLGRNQRLPIEVRDAVRLQSLPLECRSQLQNYSSYGYSRFCLRLSPFLSRRCCRGISNDRELCSAEQRTHTV